MIDKPSPISLALLLSIASGTKIASVRNRAAGGFATPILTALRSRKRLENVVPFFWGVVLGITLCVAPASLRAAEQTSEHRIVGIFSLDRVSDLHKALADIPEISL